MKKRMLRKVKVPLPLCDRSLLHALQSLESCFAQLAGRSLKANDVTCSFHSQQVLSKNPLLLSRFGNSCSTQGCNHLQSSFNHWHLCNCHCFWQQVFLLTLLVLLVPPIGISLRCSCRCPKHYFHQRHQRHQRSQHLSLASLARHDALGRATPQPRQPCQNFVCCAHGWNIGWLRDFYKIHPSFSRRELERGATGAEQLGIRGSYGME